MPDEPPALHDADSPERRDRKTEALEALRTVSVVDIGLRDGRVKRTTTRGSQRAGRILTTLGIAAVDPPPAPV